jgi:hypothetical protein
MENLILIGFLVYENSERKSFFLLAETVVVENKSACEFAYYITLDPGVLNVDEELEYGMQGSVSKSKFDCGNPYMNGVIYSQNRLSSQRSW